jgi:FKBP-type peptidyl-prolyl cis-trans isomerase 2
MERHGKPLWTPPQEIKDVVTPADEVSDSELIDKASKKSKVENYTGSDGVLYRGLNVTLQVPEKDSEEMSVPPEEVFGEDLED